MIRTDPGTDLRETSTQGSFEKAFNAEKAIIASRRVARGVTGVSHPLGLPERPEDEYYLPSDSLKNIWQELSDTEKEWIDAADEENVAPGLIGLALSGGGIRSSTFNLGVLQAIHRVGLFPYIDYLSTVSGGGYIGTYLTTSIKKRLQTPDTDAFPFKHELGVEEEYEFRHLRNHSSFLAPNGKSDLLSIPIVLLRGLVANGLLIIPAIMLAAVILGGILVDVDFSPGGTQYRLYWVDYLSLYFPAVSCFPFPASGFLAALLVLTFACYPLAYQLRLRKKIPNSDKYQTERGQRKLREDVLQKMRWYLGIAFVVFFIELQPVVLNLFSQNLSVWITAVLTGSVIATPFADKLVFGIGKLRALLGVGFYGLIGILAFWALLLGFTGLAVAAWPDSIRALSLFTPDMGLWIQTIASEPGFRELSGDNLLLWLFLIVAVGTYAWKFVDVNSTSIHKFYRDNLVRAFVAQASTEAGKTESQRKAGLLYDEETVPRLSDLTTPQSPYHLINVAVYTQRADVRYRSGRRASFFFFGQEYCGGIRTGYIKTKELESVAADLDVGTAMAVSGAAVSPNMGRHTNPLVAAVLAVFNIRLNFWLHNPHRYFNLVNEAGKEAGAGSGPDFERIRDRKLKRFSRKRVGVFYLLREILGISNVDDSFVNLSDGGHIENLGLYELLRRQCRLIIVGDGERDKQLTFQGLSEAIRLARIDFGFKIDMDGLDEIRAGDRQYAIGTIRYSRQRIGKLIYIKSNLGGDHNLKSALEPDLYRSSASRDDNQLFDDNPYVAYYKHQHPDFPQESTSDQFFDEVQFESYRALGYHVAANTLIAPYGFDPINQEIRQ